MSRFDILVNRLARLLHAVDDNTSDLEPLQRMQVNDRVAQLTNELLLRRRMDDVQAARELKEQIAKFEEPVNKS